MFHPAPPNVCALCGDELRRLADAEAAADTAAARSLYTLGCGHVFHEFCVRGWTIVGKKNTCPHCGEKVDTRAISESSPWMTQVREPRLTVCGTVDCLRVAQSVLWAYLLDGVRYLVAWNPVVIGIIYLLSPAESAAAAREG